MESKIRRHPEKSFGGIRRKQHSQASEESNIRRHAEKATFAGIQRKQHLQALNDSKIF